MDTEHIEPPPKNRQKIHWINTIFFIYAHLASLYALGWLPPSWKTFVSYYILSYYSGLSISGGLHRLWTHRSYSTGWPLKLFFAIGHLMAFQLSIYKWVQYHRIHHKYTDTNSDPHNSKRGFFFSHLGWICCRLHEDVIDKFKVVDMSDLENDFIVKWQQRLYPVLAPLFCFVLPTLMANYFWNECLWTAWNWSIVRFLGVFHGTSLINSFSHKWGTKPYDRNLTATESTSMAFFTFGEGWHNYHHTFPWDYKNAELGIYSFNTTKAMLDLCGKLGLAWDFKTATPEMIRKRILRTGDGSNVVELIEEDYLTAEEKTSIKILFPHKITE